LWLVVYRHVAASYVVGRQVPACWSDHHVLASAHDGAVRSIADSNDFRSMMLTVIPLLLLPMRKYERPVVAGD